MQARLQEAETTGPDGRRRTTSSTRSTSSLIAPFGVQTGAAASGFESRGTVTEETYDASGALSDRTTSPFALTFAVRRATGDRWLNVGDPAAGAAAADLG